ncbi:hypothetical protein Tco_0687495 [Tanacetum coccineum]|uniref:Uncharacterized protein n=1 Tax=Tanacetum coccineum TaxID=301880 RepID=A0ABQ5C1Z2_9ASTR
MTCAKLVIAKIGFPPITDDARGAPNLARRDLRNLQTTRASLVGSAFASTHFDSCDIGNHGGTITRRATDTRVSRGKVSCFLVLEFILIEGSQIKGFVFSWSFGSMGTSGKKRKAIEERIELVSASSVRALVHEGQWKTVLSSSLIQLSIVDALSTL